MYIWSKVRLVGFIGYINILSELVQNINEFLYLKIWYNNKINMENQITMKSNNPAPTVEQINADRITQVFII